MTSIRSFASEVPTPLLQQFLAGHEIVLRNEVRADTAATLVREIDVALAENPPGTRGRFMKQLEEIDQMATPQGEISIVDSVVNIPSDLPSARARALWLYLNDRSGFERAEDVLYANRHRGGRDWTGFMGNAGVKLRLDDGAKAALVKALKVYFDCENVEIEIFQRLSPATRDTGDFEGNPDSYQIMIFREGLPHAEREFEDGALTVRSRKPVIEAALTYEPDTGIIECIASAFRVREAVASAFASTMLDGPMEIVPKKMNMYSLEGLRSRRTFECDPEDQIEAVTIRYMRLVPEGDPATRITFEHMPSDFNDIWTEIERRLGPAALSSDFGIKQAKLHINYRLTSRRGKIRSLVVSVTPPNRSSLRDTTAFERMIAMKYLPRWGIVERPN